MGKRLDKGERGGGYEVIISGEQEIFVFLRRAEKRMLEIQRKKRLRRREEQECVESVYVYVCI